MAIVAGIDRRITRFLDLIAYSELKSLITLSQNDGYDILVEGLDKTLPMTFTDYSQHPFVGQQPRLVREIPIPRLFSDAAGRYQIMLRNWNFYKVSLRLPDFSPLSQDHIALELMQEHHVPSYLLNDDITNAIYAARNIWASFPGNNYGQGGNSLQALIDKYNSLT